MTKPITVLLPVRNAEGTLVTWLADVSTFADRVIALDDGSTDETSSILSKSNLVTTVLRNPVRETYAGWDDRENRQRLIDTAVRGEPSWLMFLDADERLGPSDAAALRRLVEEEAVSGFAYGFEVFRMEGDSQHYDPRAFWVFRLFSSKDAVSGLPDQALHFVPVPSGIPRTRWLQTSIRIQHFGSVTPEHREARFAKYREADPHDEFSQMYTSLLASPDTTLTWEERPDDMPLVLGVRGRYADLADVQPRGLDIALTVVVIAVNDIDVIDRSIEAILTQEVDEAFEVILVGSGDDGTVEHVRSRYPTVRCVQLPERVLPGAARNVGLWMARGAVVTFPGSHVWLTPGSLQARLDAHDDGWDMTTCAVLNGNGSAAGWASYFLDHAAQLPTRISGKFTGAPGHASYLTQDVLMVGGFPENMRAGEDTVVNQRLYNEGKRTYFSSEAAFYHASPSTTLRQLMSHHFKRGTALGKIIRGVHRGRMPVSTLARAVRLPFRRLRAVNRGMSHATPRLKRQYLRVLPLIVAGGSASAVGTWAELGADRQPSNLTAESAPLTVVPRGDGSPMLGISGRPGPGSTGLLSFGSAAQAAQRLVTLTRMAAHSTVVMPVLVPIVTSATLTAEQDGDSTTRLDEGTVQRYLDAARSVGAGLMLGIQPGHASLCDAVQMWLPFLDEPDVGLVLDVRPRVAFADQMSHLDAFSSWLNDRDKINRMKVLVIGDGTSVSPAGFVDTLIVDLSEPGGKLPHEVLADNPETRALIYL